MITSILAGVLAGLGIEAVGLVGSAAAAGGSSLALRLLRVAPAVIRLAKAVRSADAAPELHQDAERVIQELEAK